MNSTQLTAAIVAGYHHREPIMIWGPPGVGKSDVVNQGGAIIAAELVKDKKSGLKSVEDFQVIDYRLLLRDPTDIKGFGMPDVEAGVMRFLRDAELPRDGHGILFFDELPSAAPATQAAAMQLTLPNAAGEFRIGDYVLPKGFSVMAAGNRDTDRAVVHAMPTPLRNRLTHLELEVDVKAWDAWAIANDISPELIAFMRFKGEDLLFAFDPKKNANAFPTPRSWVRTEKFVLDDRLDPAVKYGMVKGTVGDDAGTQYWAFRDMIDKLPTLEEIRMDPSGCRLPDETQPSARYAIMTLLAANTSPETFEAFLTYAERVEVEFQCIFCKDAVTRQPKLRTNRIYQKWTLKNGEIIL